MKVRVTVTLDINFRPEREDLARMLIDGRGDFFTDCPDGKIAIDEADLTTDETDDSFFLFDFVKAEEIGG
jgi:hypothetical protein